MSYGLVTSQFSAILSVGITNFSKVALEFTQIVRQGDFFSDHHMEISYMISYGPNMNLRESVSGISVLRIHVKGPVWDSYSVGKCSPFFLNCD